MVGHELKGAASPMNWARKMAGPFMGVSLRRWWLVYSQYHSNDLVGTALSAFAGLSFWLRAILTHLPPLAEASEASITSWLARPSAKFGRNSSPLASAFTKSASMLMKPCS